MSTTFAKHVSPKITPQTRAIPGRESEMTQNDAGGVVFKLDKWKTLERFLIMGTEGGSFYVTEEKATIRACESLSACVLENSQRVVDTLVQISEAGRSLKNDFALFALAYVMATSKTPGEKFYARQQLNRVARIGTHILHFAEFVNQLKGWGTGTKKAFQGWYTSKTPDSLAYQYMKYKQRDGWSHRDILRLAHPYGTPEQNEVFNYITKVGSKAKEGEVKPELDTSKLPQQLQTAIALPLMSEKGVIAEIERWNLPREVIPTEMLNSIEIWKVLLPHMGSTAILRNLAKMTTIGLLAIPEYANVVFGKLTDVEQMKKDRVHPMQILFAMKTYASGKGFRGSLTWTPVPLIKSALEVAFHASFNFVQSSGKRHMMALDVSGSMGMYFIANSNVSCREAAVVMAMINARSEENALLVGFSNNLIDLRDRIRATDTFESAMKKIDGIPFSSTDCSLPMVYATERRLEVDMFTVYTDNETYAGRIQPSQALEQYRRKLGIPDAKLAVVGMTASPFTIADPKDPLMLDIAGFDPDTPQMLSIFASL
jgi:60 kDa SS-A/Ro ribonucleoprotein